MKERSIHVHHIPPEVRHRIIGEQFADIPVQSIEVLMHRRVRLSKWTLQNASDPYWRLYWPLSSGGSVTYDGRQIPLEVGRLYLIPPLTGFSSEAARTFSKWYIHFTLRGADQLPAPGVYVLKLMPRMKVLLARTCPKSDRSNVRQNTSLSWQVIELIALVFENGPSELWDSPMSDARLTRAIQYVNQAFASKLTVAELARQTGLSQRALTRLFVTHTGFAPIRYLTELRLNHCCRLLRHSTLTIEDIADQCGFANRFYLTRMMRKYRQTTPAAFRVQVKTK